MPFTSYTQTSLRWKLLLPLLIAAVAAAVIVAGLSWQLGRRWALHEVQERFEAIERTLKPASFPLTGSVSTSLAALSGCELIALDERGRLAASTLSLAKEPFDTSAISSHTFNAAAPNAGSAGEQQAIPLHVAGRDFLAFEFRRQSGPSSADSAARVLVLFDRSRIRSASRRAAVLPLVTGLSTIVLLSTLTIVVTKTLSLRVAQLHHQVQQIAAGDFGATVDDDSQDELGRLGAAVNSMSHQLRNLWQEVNRQQSQKLLHQLAAGMAHQLRNTLTGARLALELHQASCSDDKRGEEVEVALREMLVAEDYIQRILVVGSGEHRPNRIDEVIDVLKEVRDSHVAIAKHLRVRLDWRWDGDLAGLTVTDGPSLRAALSNLVLNALQASQWVSVDARLLGEACCAILICDDGPGIEPAVADHLFDPFISSKPEGLGLGLPVVRRAAEKLGGTVEWRREAERTVFEFRCLVQPATSLLRNSG